MLDHERLDAYRISIEFVSISVQVYEAMPRGNATLVDQLKIDRNQSAWERQRALDPYCFHVNQDVWVVKERSRARARVRSRVRPLPFAGTRNHVSSEVNPSP